jgi:hypothetical protein
MMVVVVMGVSRRCLANNLACANESDRLWPQTSFDSIKRWVLPLRESYCLPNQTPYNSAEVQHYGSTTSCYYGF